MLANRRWLMRDYVRGFAYCPLRLTGEIDVHPDVDRRGLRQGCCCSSS